MPELLLELLSEEIPARMQERAAASLRELVGAALKDAELPPARIETYVTPRRLALVARDLPAKQPDLEVEKRDRSRTVVRGLGRGVDDQVRAAFL